MQSLFSKRIKIYENLNSEAMIIKGWHICLTRMSATKRTDCTIISTSVTCCHNNKKEKKFMSI